MFPTRLSIAQTILAVQSTVLRPFRQQVDIENVVLLIVLVLVISGLWHMVLERIDMHAERIEEL